MPVWFIGHSLEYHRRDIRARLRRCLTRMSAEIAAMQSLGRMSADSRFQSQIDQLAEADYFRHFVTSSLQQIQADRRAGVTQLVMTDLVLAVMEAAAPGGISPICGESTHRSTNADSILPIDSSIGLPPASRMSRSATNTISSSRIRARMRSRQTRSTGASGAQGQHLCRQPFARPGNFWPDRLLAAQKASKVTIALVSENSVKSIWFKSECITALELLNSGLARAPRPVLLDASEMPYGTNVVQGIGLTQGVTIDTVVDRLMEALAGISGEPA